MKDKKVEGNVYFYRDKEAYALHLKALCVRVFYTYQFLVCHQSLIDMIAARLSATGFTTPQTEVTTTNWYKQHEAVIGATSTLGSLAWVFDEITDYCLERLTDRYTAYPISHGIFHFQIFLAEVIDDVFNFQWDAPIIFPPPEQKEWDASNMSLGKYRKAYIGNLDEWAKRHEKQLNAIGQERITYPKELGKDLKIFALAFIGKYANDTILYWLEESDEKVIFNALGRVQKHGITEAQRPNTRERINAEHDEALSQKIRAWLKDELPEDLFPRAVPPLSDKERQALEEYHKPAREKQQARMSRMIRRKARGEIN